MSVENGFGEYLLRLLLDVLERSNRILTIDVWEYGLDLSEKDVGRRVLEEAVQ